MFIQLFARVVQIQSRSSSILVLFGRIWLSILRVSKYTYIYIILGLETPDKCQHQTADNTKFTKG